MSTDTFTPQRLAKHAYSILEFRDAFSIGRSRIYEEIKLGRIQIIKVGSRTIISHQEAMRWLNSFSSNEMNSKEIK